MSRSHSTLIPPLARRSTQLLLACSVAVLFAWQAALGIRDSLQQDTTIQPSTDIASILIDINRCEPRELSLLPSVGPVLAKRIVADRETNGSFSSVQQLQRVRGIGEKTVARIAAYCTTGESAKTGEGTGQEPASSGNLIAAKENSQ